MKIGITTMGKELDSLVSPDFKSSPYCLIVETDNLSFCVYSNAEKCMGEGIAMARAVVDSNCEAVITNRILQPAFDELAGACITRYAGESFSAKDALDLMEAYQLNLIRDYEGADPHAHDHHGSCDCGE